MILDIDDDEKFLRYLSEHCYDNEQKFQLARSIISDEIELVRTILLRYEADRILSPERLNSMTIEALLGYKYQSGSFLLSVQLLCQVYQRLHRNK